MLRLYVRILDGIANPCRAGKLNLKSKQFAEALGLGAADRDFSLLAIVHAELV
jgi:hypothetical protein